MHVHTFGFPRDMVWPLVAITDMSGQCIPACLPVSHMRVGSEYAGIFIVHCIYGRVPCRENSSISENILGSHLVSF
jgi:hypothetical protein